MVDPVQELKTRAEILQRQVLQGEPDACKRLRALAELARAADDALAAAAGTIRRKHCLAVVAREHGFSSWEHAQRVLEGSPTEPDFGTMLYPPRGSGSLNVWFTDYREARGSLEEAQGRQERRYLLAYRKQFFVAEAPFVETLGLDPFDSDWEAMAFDWVEPRDTSARRRMYGKRLQAMRGAR
jgi:hypothetical protein